MLTRMPVRMNSAIAMRRSQRLRRLVGGGDLPELQVCSSFIVVAGPTFSRDKFEVHLSMPQEDS
jgi:hypothetical protein